MCGVAGILDLHGDREIDERALQRMTDALAHRGPDGEGYYSAPGIGLGHRRLAIIDIDGGVQPFHAQERGGVLSFNGEIYNFRDLAKAHKEAGVALQTRSDTEVLAEGLARRGPRYIAELRGMFAFAFWRPEKRSLILARDRLGEKPLYYAETEDGHLIFASEIGALLASGMVRAEINPQAVADYFFYGYIPDPKTIYTDIKKLPPAHVLYAKPGAPLTIKRYWRPVFSPDHKFSFSDASAALAERLDEAVAAQMISDAPLGAFLSAGIDSAGVVSAMHAKDARLATCTVGFHEAKDDERARARSLAERLGADHHEHIVHLDIATLIDDVAAALGEPFADSGALSSYAVAKLASANVKVALTGDGGDEIFAGYRRYPFFVGEERVRAMAPLSMRRMTFGAAGTLYPKLDSAPRFLRAKTTLQALGATRTDAYAAAVAINLPIEARALLHPDLKHALNGYRSQSVIEAALKGAEGGDALALAQHADLLTWLPGRMLVKVDRTSMAHGLEARPPLLDHKLVEWAGALPSAHKLRGGVGKRILRNALQPRLGRDWVTRKKSGFALPIGAMLRRTKDNPLDRLTGDAPWRACGLLNEKIVDDMIDAHQRGAGDCAQALWSVIMFDAFLRATKG